MLFEPGDIFEARVKRNEDKGAAQTWFHYPARASQFAEVICPIHEKHKRHVWVGVCPREAEGSTNAIVCRVLWADLNSTITTLEQAKAALEESGLPAPTMLVNSGNGFHVYWKLEKPVPAKDVRPWAKGVHKSLPADSTHDPTRVMRVPGTLNVKDPENPTRAHIVEYDPSRVYPIELFPKAEIAPPAAVPGAPAKRVSTKLSETDFNTFVANWVEGQKHNLAVAVAGYLRKNLYYSREECEAEIARIHAAAGYEMDDNLRKVVADTYAQPFATVAGVSKLREFGIFPKVHDALKITFSAPPKPKLQIIDFTEEINDQEFWIDGLVGPGLLTLWAAEPKTGKAQPLSGGVLTPTGFRPMGSLQVGDEVVGADGRPTRVTHLHPQGEQDIYRVTFSDGTYTDVTLDHLWAVRERSNGGRVRETVVSTRDMLGNLRAGDKWRYSIPFAAPAHLAPQPVPFDPYTLGVLLGDGCFVGAVPTLTNSEADIIERVSHHLPGLHLRADGRTYSWSSAEFSDLLNRWGLAGAKSEDKFVPPEYLTNSIPVRLAILQGLLDADGSVSTPGKSFIEFSTVSPRLRDDVVELVRSLGGRATWVQRESHYTIDGVRYQAQPSYRVSITPHPDVTPVSSEKHLARYVPKRKPHFKAVVDVSFNRREEAQCITVEAADHLYVAEGYNVTHNSFAAMQMGYALSTGNPLWDFATDGKRHKVLYFQGELTMQMVRQRAKNMFGLQAVRDPTWYAITAKPDEPIDLVRDPEILTDLADPYDVVIVDPISVFHANDENSSHSVKEVLSVFHSLQSAGKAVVLIHHTNKLRTDQNGMPVGVSFSNIRGSGTWFAAADSLALHYRISDRVTEVKFAFRAAPDRDPLKLYRLPNGGFTADFEEFREASREAGIPFTVAS